MIQETSIFKSRLYFILSILFLITMPSLNIWAAGTPNRLGFVDMEKAVAGTREWKKEFKLFKAAFQKEKIKIATKEKQIKMIFEELKKQASVLRPELKQEKEEKFRAEKKDFERYVQDKNEDFSRKEKALTAKMLKKMVKVIRKIGKDKKMTMILDHKMAIYYSTENDLTPLAIRTYDRMNK